MAAIGGPPLLPPLLSLSLSLLRRAHTCALRGIVSLFSHYTPPLCNQPSAVLTINASPGYKKVPKTRAFNTGITSLGQTQKIPRGACKCTRGYIEALTYIRAARARDGRVLKRRGRGRATFVEERRAAQHVRA